MTSDLLFSVLPREGKVPISHEIQKVQNIEKQEKWRVVSDVEQELKGEARDARKRQQESKKHNSENKREDKEKEAKRKTKSNDTEAGSSCSKGKPKKGPKHLDLYV
jgi:hypothetical protein